MRVLAFSFLWLVVTAAASELSGRPHQESLATFPWSQVSAGATYVCAIDATGRAACWGAAAASPRPVPQAPAFTMIAVGRGVPCAPDADGPVCDASDWGHACALTADGHAFCWGDNGFGQLGDGTTRSRSTPAPVAGGLTFRSIAAGRGFTCGLSVAREAGSAAPGRPGLGEESTGRRADGSAYCWGFNGKGHLGTGERDQQPHPHPVLIAREVRAVAVAADFACALHAEGQAYCWGEDYHGRLGSDAASGTTATPVPVNGVSRFAALSAGATHVCGLTPTGEARCWGSNVDGQLAADPERIAFRRDPTAVGAPPLTDITASPAGHTCGIARDGAAWCWGRNAAGELGVGGAAEDSCYGAACVPRPTQVAGAHLFRSISAGAGFTCGVTREGGLVCWGRLPWGSGRSTAPVAPPGAAAPAGSTASPGASPSSGSAAPPGSTAHALSRTTPHDRGSVLGRTRFAGTLINHSGGSHEACNALRPDDHAARECPRPRDGGRADARRHAGPAAGPNRFRRRRQRTDE